MGARLGITTLCRIVASEMGVNIPRNIRPVIEKPVTCACSQLLNRMMYVYDENTRLE
jgi:Holliday junction resolvasome RuvABC ATP-dependent DNA helicase subunit